MVFRIEINAYSEVLSEGLLKYNSDRANLAGIYCIDMKLGSHNSLTYLPPKKWWMKIFNFMAKCQSKDIKLQYEKYGVRLFDFRIDFDNKGNLLVKHGLAVYNINEEGFLKILEFLNKKAFKKYVNIVLECSYKESKDVPLWKELEFIKFCKLIELNYKRIVFIGGQVKHSWKNLYKFKYCTDQLDVVSNYASSTTKCKLDDLWPWLYAKLHNRKAIKDNTHKFLWLDFVNVR